MSAYRRWILCTGILLGGLAHAAPPTADTPKAERSPLVAGLLGGVVGFGAGHLYAHERLTSQTALYGALDLFTAMATVELIKSRPAAVPGHTADGFWTFGMVTWGSLLAVLRLVEGFSASGIVERRNALSPDGIRTLDQERFPSTAGFLGAFVGFGTGHWYAHGRWTQRSTLFAILDTLAGLVAVAGVMRLSSGTSTGLFYEAVPLEIVRIWQGLEAAGESRAFNESLWREPSAPAPEAPQASVGFPLLTVRF